MNKKKKKEFSVEERNKVFSFFTLAFPTILIVVIGMLLPSLWLLNIALAFYQFILIKQFLDRHYEIIG